MLFDGGNIQETFEDLVIKDLEKHLCSSHIEIDKDNRISILANDKFPGGPRNILYFDESTVDISEVHPKNFQIHLVEGSVVIHYTNWETIEGFFAEDCVILGDLKIMVNHELRNLNGLPRECHSFLLYGSNHIKVSDARPISCKKYEFYSGASLFDEDVQCIQELLDKERMMARALYFHMPDCKVISINGHKYHFENSTI